MKSFATLVLFFLVLSISCVFGGAVLEAETYSKQTTQAKASSQAKPNALRSSCAYVWDRYYKKERIDIRVSTKGAYDETVVFTCPDCSMEEHFVNPFLNSEYQGETGMDRIKECGFTQVVFKGARGLEEIVRQVP